MRYKNLIVIGTSHISSHSIKTIRKTIEKEDPGVVAVELDKKRLQGLLDKEAKNTRLSLDLIKKIGLKGFLFALLGSWLQKKLGKIVGIDPGSDMLAAVEAAKKRDIKIALIDQDIELTLMKFSRSLTWKEKGRFIVDIFKPVFSRKKQLKRYGLENMDLSKVPTQKVIRIMIKELKQRYPSIYTVLIEERNNIMAYNLVRLMRLHPNEIIVAVIGAGHEKELMQMVNSAFDDQDTITYEFSIN